jgi:hypothetical protein
MTSPSKSHSYAALLAAADSTPGALRTFRTDLTRHDLAWCEARGDAAPFAWLLGNHGTYTATLAKIRNLLRAYLPEPGDTWFVWTGSALVRVADAPSAADLLSELERYAA